MNKKLETFLARLVALVFTIAAGFFIWFLGHTRVQLAALRSGKISVFVNPENPQDSVMDRSLPLDQVLFAIIFLLFPCGVGTAFSLGMLSAGLSRLGPTSLERYYLPLLGILHSAPVLYPLIYAHESFGFGSWIIALVFMALLAVSLRSIWRRIQDPSISVPRWPERLRARSGGGFAGSSPDRHA